MWHPVSIPSSIRVCNRAKRVAGNRKLDKPAWAGGRESLRENQALAIVSPGEATVFPHCVERQFIKITPLASSRRHGSYPAPIGRLPNEGDGASIGRPRWAVFVIRSRHKTDRTLRTDGLYIDMARIFVWPMPYEGDHFAIRGKGGLELLARIGCQWATCSIRRTGLVVAHPEGIKANTDQNDQQKNCNSCLNRFASSSCGRGNVLVQRLIWEWRR